jgi:TIR domain
LDRSCRCRSEHGQRPGYGAPRGPSTIGIDTIYRSQGKIPEVFLRGAGLPDEFIAYIGSFVGHPIQFYSCFISYSTKDQEFAERLHADLQAKGVRCWFAPHDVKGGEKLHEQIDAAIRLHDKLLLILSEHSMNSEWVKTEIAKGRKRELREGKRVLFPVRLVGFATLRDWECFDGDTGKDSAREIREYFILDFANWKEHDSYQKGFDRLLRDLKSPDTVAEVRMIEVSSPTLSAMAADEGGAPTV